MHDRLADPKIDRRLFAWLVRLVFRPPAMRLPALWIGNLLSALLFAVALISQLSVYGLRFLLPFLAFSSGSGLLMGWVYMQYGLVAAVTAHFICDLVANVLPRMF